MPYAILALIIAYRVNVPYMDEWQWTDFVYDLHRGTLTFAELWAPHNEHRIFVPNLIIVVLARLGGWYIVRQQMVGLAGFVACQFLLWRLIRRTVPVVVVPLTFFCVSALLYSLGQSMNFAFGDQLGWPICTFAVLSAALLLTKPDVSAADVALAALAGVVGSYSSGQGFLTWPVGVLLLLFARRRSARLLAVWIACGVMVVVLDRLGRHATGAYPPVGAGMLLEYSLAYVGNPLAGWAGIMSSMEAGLLCVLAIVAFAVDDVIRRDRNTFDRRLPWYGLAAYAIAAAPITGFARFGSGGLAEALASRYVSISSLLTMALVVLLVQYAVTHRHVLARTTAIAAVGVMMLLLIPTNEGGLAFWQGFAIQRQADLDEIRRGDVAAATDTFPNMTLLFRYVWELQQTHDGPFRPGG